MERVLSLMYTGMFGVLLCGFAVLAVLSSGEELPGYARDPPWMRPVRKMAVYLCRHFQLFREKRRRRGKDLFIPGEEGARADLLVLYPSLKARREEIRYQTGKIERLLLLLFSGIVLAGGLHIHSLRAGILQEDGKVERAQTGGADRSLRVTALPVQETQENQPAPDATDSSTGDQPGERTGEDAAENSGRKEGEEKDYGTYTVTVHARQYTAQEAETRARQILRQFPDSILGENEAPDQIRAPLEMPPASAAEPFSLSWESSRYAVLDTDGSIFNSEYSESRAEEVELTAVLTYAGYRFQKKMDFVVRAPVRNEEELLQEQIRGALLTAEKDSASGPYYTLPSEAGGLSLTWKERAEDLSGSVLILGITACVLAWYVMDSRLHERTRVRSRQLAIDYPQLTSKFVLYMGAGMSVRNVFYKCAADYREKRPAGTMGRGGLFPKRQTIRYLYEEILLVCNELESGVSETEAYMHFGRRCRSRQYTKLASLLVQNLRRGNDTLLQVLQEEAQSSFEERKNLARELGEEAGTKLLLPMMIMLGITMLIIIVPAYFSFSM